MAAQPQGGNVTSRRRNQDSGETLISGTHYILDILYCTPFPIMPHCPSGLPASR